MQHTDVLVITTRDATELLEELVDAGFVPVTRNRMGDALATLRHECIPWVLVDTKNADIDALEFILNARDIDEEVPIVVLEEAPVGSRKEALLRQWPNVYPIPRVEPPAQVVADFCRLAATA